MICRFKETRKMHFGNMFVKIDTLNQVYVALISNNDDIIITRY